MITATQVKLTRKAVAAMTTPQIFDVLWWMEVRHVHLRGRWVSLNPDDDEVKSQLLLDELLIRKLLLRMGDMTRRKVTNFFAAHRAKLKALRQRPTEEISP